MTSNYNFDDDTFDDDPSWLLDNDEDTAVAMTDATDSDDQFDQLRRKSARNESLYDEMETTATSETAATNAPRSSSFAWSSFTPGQRLILALLVLVDIVAILVLVLVLTGIL